MYNSINRMDKPLETAAVITQTKAVIYMLSDLQTPKDKKKSYKNCGKANTTSRASPFREKIKAF